MYFEARNELADADGMNRVWTPDGPEIARFIWAWAISDSKSDRARSPLMMKSAPTSWASVDHELVEVGDGDVVEVGERLLDELLALVEVEERLHPSGGCTMAATTTSSNRWQAVSTISRCPLWNGSNEPG